MGKHWAPSYHLPGHVAGTLCGRRGQRFGVPPATEGTAADCARCLTIFRLGPMVLLRKIANQLRRLPHEATGPISVYLGVSNKAVDFLLSLGGKVSDKHGWISLVVPGKGVDVIFWATPLPPAAQGRAANGSGEKTEADRLFIAALME